MARLSGVMLLLLLLAAALVADTPALTADLLAGKQFRFSWREGQHSGQNGIATLDKSGRIGGISSPNETYWLVDEQGRLVFKHRDGRVSTIFDHAEQRDGKWILSGPFQFSRGVDHVLEEIGTAPTESGEDVLNRIVRPYSTQRIVCLDPGESTRYTLRNGQTRTVRLVAVQEERDRVINHIRRAAVRVEIDGQPLRLDCTPYVMPTETAGLRLQADTTSGWTPLPKRVQFSLWDASLPIVDVNRFRFPLRRFRLFSHGTQAFNEPVHLGLTDGDPAGNKFYHNYGFDLAGYEGAEEVLSAIDGKVVLFWPSRENLCSVGIDDSEGFHWEFAHLSAVEPHIVLGARVAAGQRIGTLGRTGPSGNFSHLHLASCLPRDASGRDWGNNTRLNLYPWVVTAYQAERPKGLFAVARPHQTVQTGETVVLDASRSLAFGGRRIVDWRWTLDTGEEYRQARAEVTFNRPGAYVATLWVKDDTGAADVDFCQVKVYSAGNREHGLPHIFMTSTPTEEVRPGQPVRLRCWFQGRSRPPFAVDFGDGEHLADCRSYTELSHQYAQPGVYVVTARAESDGKPVCSKLKVVVTTP